MITHLPYLIFDKYLELELVCVWLLLLTPLAGNHFNLEVALFDVLDRPHMLDKTCLPFLLGGWLALWPTVLVVHDCPSLFLSSVKCLLGRLSFLDHLNQLYWCNYKEQPLLLALSLSSMWSLIWLIFSFRISWWLSESARVRIWLFSSLSSLVMKRW